MSDMISRQDAIDAAIEATDSWEGFCSIGRQKRIKNYINSLPFAPGMDLISRRAAIDICANVIDLFREQFGAGVLVAIKESIEELPSAQTEIVKCKNCKHWIPYDWMFSEVWRSQSINDYPEDEIGCIWCDMAMKANDFCSRAERRTE